MEADITFTETIKQELSKIQHLLEKYQSDYFPLRTPQFFCLELNGEAGELANAEKKRWKGKIVDDVIFNDEAADVFIALMNYSNSRKINLGEAVKNKIEFIEKKRLELKKQGEDY